MTQLLLIGWKDIRGALGNVSERTARDWVSRFRMPIKYMGRRPTITRTKFDEWWENLPESVKNELSYNLPANFQ